MNDFDKQLQKAHSYNSYKEHFESVYRVAQGFKIVLLGISCLFSAYFFSAWTGFLGAEYAIYGGVVLSVLLAVVIGTFTNKALVYWSAQRTIEPLIFMILIASLSLNIYADFNGAETLGSELAGVAPTDTKTAELSGIYTPQIASIDSQIEKLESDNFYWCGLHRAAHICDNPKNVRHVNTTVRGDIEAVAQISDLNAQKSALVGTMNTLLSDNGEAFKQAIGTHSANVTQSKSKMRFGSLVCTFFYLAFSLWAHKYGLRANKEMNSTQYVATRTPAKKKRKKQPARNTGGSVTIDNDSFFDDREELSDDELAEELRAMRDKERIDRKK